MIKLAVSMASAPLLDLKTTVNRLEKAGVDYLHFDVEDGSFVKEMRLGINIIQQVREVTKLPFDVHLMMVDPEWIIPILAEIGVELLSVHYEATLYPRRILGMIRDAGMKAGLAFNPKTEIPDLSIYLPYLYFVDILTTEPEKGDSIYLPHVLEKVKTIRSNMRTKNIICEVDGGFNAANISDAISAGADIVVAGRSIFEGGDMEENIRKLQSA